MENDDQKLAIIIGCSLGGAALIVALILIAVICCSKKRNADKKRADNQPVDIEPYNTYSLQKSGMPPGFHPQFSGSGNQQWTQNLSVTRPPSGVENADQYVARLPRVALGPTGNQYVTHNDSDLQKKKTIPWNQRTLERMRKISSHNSSSPKIKQDKGVAIVGDLQPYSPNSAYALNRRTETHAPGKRLSDSSEDSRTELEAYGSRVTLIARERELNNQKNKAASHDNKAKQNYAVYENAAVQELHSVSQHPLNDYVEHSKIVGEPTSLWDVKKNQDLAREAQLAKQHNLLANQRMPTTDLQMVRERPTPLVSAADRGLYMMPLDARNLDPRVDQPKLHQGVSEQTIKASIEQRPHSGSILSDEKNTIQQAFMFLDELDE